MAIAIITLLLTGILTCVYLFQNKLLYMPGNIHIYYSSKWYVVIPDMPLSPGNNPRGYRHPK